MVDEGNQTSFRRDCDPGPPGTAKRFPLAEGNQTSFRRDCDMNCSSPPIRPAVEGNQTSFRRDCDARIRRTLSSWRAEGNQTSFRRDCDMPDRLFTLKWPELKEIRPHLEGIATINLGYSSTSYCGRKSDLI